MKAFFCSFFTAFWCFFGLYAQQENSPLDRILSLQKEVYEHKNKANFEEALITLNKATQMAESTDQSELLVDLYNLYTQLHIEFNKLDKVNTYVATTKNALSFYEYPDGRKLEESFEARLMAENKQFSEAILKASKLTTGLSNNNKEISGMIAFNQANIYFLTKDYATAKGILQKMLPVENKFEKEYLTAQVLLLLSEINILQGFEEDAYLDATKALEIAAENDFPKVEFKANNILASISEKKKNFEDAYRFKVAAEKVYNHHFISNTANSNNETANSTEAAFLNRLVTQMGNQLEKTEKTVNISKLTSVLSSALLIIISLLTISLYRNNQIKFKTNDLLLKKNQELQAAKDEAEKAMQAKGQFLSTVSHELRTPLYAVTGLTHLLLEEDPKESQKDHLKSLKFSGEYLLNFINDILQINKIEANKLSLESFTFDLRKVFTDVATSLQQTAKENKNNIVLEISESIPQQLIGDPLKLTQILMNLVGNALKFTENGNVTMLAKPLNHSAANISIHFEIIDQGIGISKEMQETIFDSFSQGSVQINRKYGGTGLGLTIVKSLLSLFNSEIKVESELGKGSTFMFDIDFKVPEAYTADIPSKRLEIEDGFFEKLHLLVVEDNKINQVITQKMLAKKGMTCDIANDGYEAIEKARKNSYHAILMDIHMPGISGLTATKEIRKFNKNIPIIALTAISLDETKEDFFAAGCSDVITKPFKPELFYRKIGNNILRNINVGS